MKIETVLRLARFISSLHPSIRTDTVYGNKDEPTPYQTRIKFGKKYRLHIFFRGDGDPDPHDHPFSFKTFPLIRTYHEKVLTSNGETFYNEVRRWKWHDRPRDYTHLVVDHDKGHKIWTFVKITSPSDNDWGFWVRLGFARTKYPDLDLMALPMRYGLLCTYVRIPWVRYVYDPIAS